MAHPSSAPLPGADPALPTVHVRLFASLREAAGWSDRPVSLPFNADQRPCTPLQLWQRLEISACWPSPEGSAPSGPLAADPASAFPAGLRVAINQRFAAPDTPLQPGDELAFLPPITGG
jgi:molybdopterin synthase sulfur carrier subunit